MLASPSHSRSRRTAPRTARSRLRAAVELQNLESRRLFSASFAFNGAQTPLETPAMNVSADNSFGQSNMLLAVNPNDAIQLAGIVEHVGGQNEIDVYRSVDGGARWSKTIIDNGAAGTSDGAGAGTRFGPAIAYGDDNNLYVAYCVDTGTSTSIVVGHSYGNYTGFGNFRTIASGTDLYNGTVSEIHGTSQVSLATGPDGAGGNALYVSYIKTAIETGGEDDRVMLDATHDGGNTFLGGVIVNNASVTGADSGNLSPDVAVGPGGQTYVVWHNANIDTGVERLLSDKDLDGRFVNTFNFGTDGTIKSFPNGSLIGYAVPAQPQHGVYTNPRLAVDRSGGPNNGRVYLSYVDQTSTTNLADTDVHVLRYNGSTWTDALAFSSPGSEFDPQVAVDRNSGAVGVAFYSSATSASTTNDAVDPYLSVSLDGGATWSASVVATPHSVESGGYTGDYSDHLGLAFRDGVAHVMWAARHGAGTDLDAFTANVGFVSSTGTNVAQAVTPYPDVPPGTNVAGYTRVTRSGDYLLVVQGPTYQEAFLAASLNLAVIYDMASLDNTIVVDNPSAGVPLNIYGGPFLDDLQVLSLPANTPVTFQGFDGNDYCDVSTNDKNIDPIQSPVSFYGGNGFDSMNVYDETQTAGHLYTVTSSSVSRANFGGGAGSTVANYDGGVEDVGLYAGGGSDQVNVSSTQAQTSVDVWLGNGDDALYLGNGNVATIQGAVWAHGGSGGDDYFAIVDNQTFGSDDYHIDDVDFQRGAYGRTVYTDFEEMSLLAERGNNHITVDRTMPGCLYEINANDGTDTIDVNGTDPAAPVNVMPSGGDDTVNVNTDNVGTAKVVFPYSERIGALNVGNGGVAQLPPGAGGDEHMLTVTSISFGTGQLDVTDGSLVVDYSGPTSPFASVRDAVTSGYFAGGWTGAGIMSSYAAADATHTTGVGYAQSTDLFTAFPGQFRGHAVDGTSILLTYTLDGDANLDRAVNLTDFTYLAANFNSTSATWSRGDFSFDGRVDLTDFTILAANFNKSMSVAASANVLTAAVRPATVTPPRIFSGTPLGFDDRELLALLE